MKCKNCGAEVNKYEPICPHCGEYLATPNTQKSNNSFILKHQDSHNREQSKSRTTNGTSGEHMHTNLGVSRFKSIFNFDNIGRKIKTFAQLFCWIGIVMVWISCAIMFFVCLFQSQLRSMWWVPLLSAVIMPFTIWISSWYTYAIGNFIENDQRRTDSQEKIAQVLNNNINVDK